MKRFNLYFILLVILSFSTDFQAKSVDLTHTGAGTLSNQITKEEQSTLTELTIKGPLNGDDIFFIREMASHLQVLDIGDAKIVSGGSSYQGDNFTQDNVIGIRMFYAMSTLKKLILPQSAIKIDGKYTSYDNISGEAIAQCTNLESVTLPAALQEIGCKTFYFCTKLSSITIPDGVKTIGTYAFQDCKALTSITLSKSLGKDTHFVREKDYFSPLTNEYQYVFQGCLKLAQVIMPEGLEALTPYMFSGCESLTEVTLPSTIKALNGAFSNTPITHITLPAGLIQVYDFSDCRNLTSLVIPEGSKGYLKQDRVQQFYTPKGAFGDCTSLESLTLPQSLIEIPNYAFRGCKKLKEIEIPTEITKIGEYAFEGCTSLASVKLSDKLIEIGKYAFINCAKLGSIKFPAKVTTINQGVFKNCTSLQTIVFPDDLRELGSDIFVNCSSLETVEFPQNLISIGSGTFKDCIKLNKIKFSPRLTTIGYSAFENCKSLKTVSIPGSAENIGNSAFGNCGLEEATLEMGIVSIKENIFSGCKYLVKVNFPESMTAIGGLAETGIKEVIFPKNAVAIESRAFTDCDSLRSIIIPEGIEIIRSSAFLYCDSLTQVQLPSTLKEIEEGAFSSTNLKEITLPEGIKKLKESTFSKCRNLKTVNLPQSIISIEGAFAECINLTEIILPENLTELGRGTFSSCIRLANITLPEGISTIKNSTFSACYALKKITIPENVTAIEENAFYNAGIADINIPITVQSIGKDAFYCGYYYENDQKKELEINSVIWNSAADFPCEAFNRIKYLYVPKNTEVSEKSIASYIFYDGVTDAFKIAATNGYFSISQEIKTKKVSYTKLFSAESGYNEPAGWKTIVLPFDVNNFEYAGDNWQEDENMHESLAPFGNKLLEKDETARPFWLYELTTNGNYQAVTQMKANKPYLICMPNNYAYPQSSNIKGWVRFYAEDERGITLPVTNGALIPSEGAIFNLVPTYETVKKSEEIYTLNENNSYNEYRPGSVFIRNYADVAPFQAYVQTKAGPASAPKFYSIGGNGGSITGFENLILTPDQATKAYSKNGILCIESNAARTIRIYDASGRTIRVIEAQKGHNEVNGLAEGVYFLEGQKVMVTK